MKKMLTTIAAAALLGATSLSAEPEVSFSGYFDADFASGDVANIEDGEVLGYTTGLEADLALNIAFSEKVTVDFFLTMLDGTVPAMGSGEWWPAVYFDGVMGTWNVTDDMSLLAGDLVFGNGYFGYYFYKRSAAVISEFAFRGLGATFNGLTLATGMAGATGWGMYASYEAAVPDVGTITPVAKLVLGESDGVTSYQAGVTYDLAFGDMALAGGFGVNGETDMDVGYTILIEPSIAIDVFSVAASFLYQEKGEEPSSNVPVVFNNGTSFDDMIFYIEPGMAFNDYVALGLPLEYHDPDMDNEIDASFWAVPTLYLYPADGAQVWIWGQAVVPLHEDGGDMGIYFGSELIVEF